MDTAKSNQNLTIPLSSQRYIIIQENSDQTESKIMLHQLYKLEFNELFRLHAYLLSSIAFINFSGELDNFHKGGLLSNCFSTLLFLTNSLMYEVV